jgi:hypothetical protein
MPLDILFGFKQFLEGTALGMFTLMVSQMVALKWGQLFGKSHLMLPIIFIMSANITAAWLGLLQSLT